MIWVQRYHDAGTCISCGAKGRTRISDSGGVHARTLVLCVDCEAALAFVCSVAAVELEASAEQLAELAAVRFIVVDHREQQS